MSYGRTRCPMAAHGGPDTRRRGLDRANRLQWGGFRVASNRALDGVRFRMEGVRVLVDVRFRMEGVCGFQIVRNRA